MPAQTAPQTSHLSAETTEFYRAAMRAFDDAELPFLVGGA